MPKSYAELMKVRATLEKHFKDVQDVEFTIQEGKLFMLQTRNGKRTAAAALKFSMDMFKEKLIDWETAVLRNPADQLDQLLAPIFDLGRSEEGQGDRERSPRRSRRRFRQDLPQRRPRRRRRGEGRESPARPQRNQPGRSPRHDRGRRHPHRERRRLLARRARRPPDGQGLHLRRLRACRSTTPRRPSRSANKTFKEGDFLSIDGTAGTVYGGQLATAPSEIITGMLNGDKAAQKTEKFKAFNQLMKWCAQATRLDVRTNADNPEQTRKRARLRRGRHRPHPHGAHVLRRRPHRRHARDDPRRQPRRPEEAALAKLLPYQREDFIGIFKALKGYPATIRFLDPPLHEFLPHEAKAQAELGKKIGVSAEKIKQRVDQLHEFNPMLGHRGCRLGIAYPEITEMQARAIFEAAAEVAKKKIKVKPEVMIPLVGFKKELDLQVEIVHRVAAEVMAEKKVKFDYLVGTMIEVPRGALTADRNRADRRVLQLRHERSHADRARHQPRRHGQLPHALHRERNLQEEPVRHPRPDRRRPAHADRRRERPRARRPNIKLGICGEHGGDPDSVKFCHQLGLDYVSCSPFRVPVARLAAAQAAIAK